MNSSWNYSELLEKCGSHGVKLMTSHYMALEVYKCVNNMNPQYLNKCMYDRRDNCPLERLAALTYNLWYQIFQNLWCQIWNLLPATYKMGMSFNTFKTWSKLGLDQPANVVSAVCLQLDFPIKSMYNNLTNQNCLFVLNWCCGLIWSIVAWLRFLFSTFVGK